MKTRKRIALLFLVAAALVPAIYFFARSKPFVYEGKPLDQWLDGYTDLHFQNKFSEMQAMDRKMRGLGPSAVPPLVAALKTKHQKRAALYRFLVKRSWKYQWSRDLQYKSLITSSRPQTAAQFLYDIGPDAAPAIPALLMAAQNTDLALRANALNALGSIQQQPEVVVPVLIRALTNSWDLPYAVYNLGRFGTNAIAAAPALRTLAGTSKSLDTQMSALMALEKIAPDSAVEVAMPLYLRILKDPHNWNQYTVILRLIKLGGRANEAVPLLSEIARQTDDTGQAAAYALKAIDPAAAAKIWPSVPRGEDLDEGDFEKMLAKKETQEQFDARVGAMGGQKLPYLIKLVRARPASGNVVTEYEHAARALGAMGAAAQTAVPELVQATNDTRWFVRVAAQAALIRINGESLTPVINELKNNADPDWYVTAMLVAEFGTNAEPAIPVVIAAMKDGDDIVQGHGAVLLGAIHRQPDVCLPVLVSLLDSPSVSSRQKAMGALSEFGDAAKPALPKIKAARDDFDPFVRVLAARFIKLTDTNTSVKAEIK